MIMKKSQSIFIKKTPEWDEKEVSYANEVLEFSLNSLLSGGEKKYEVSVLLTNDSEIRQLNKKYRNIDKATNVLSFSIESDAFLNDIKMIGDLVLSKERIINEAHEQKKTFNEHFAHLLIHGFLHLIDFSHESQKDSNLMEKKEVELLSKLNIPNPYEERL
tara:strand:+ start:241 stop:723 length:483 start_codon:yes stop_codon:yes gene_type:complete